MSTVGTQQGVRYEKENFEFLGVVNFGGPLSFTQQDTQTLLATDNILVSEAVVSPVVGSGGSVTLSSTPTLPEGFPFQLVILVGTDDTTTVTVQDISNLPGSTMNLGGADRVLGRSDYLGLMFNDITEEWDELFFKDN